MIILLRFGCSLNKAKATNTKRALSRCRRVSHAGGRKVSKMPAFKDILSSARIEKGLQQKDLALALDVVPAYISRLEKGFSLPSNDLILKICHILGMNLQQVYLQVILEKTEIEPLREIIKILQGSLSETQGSSIQKLDLSQLDEAAAEVVRKVFDALAGRDAVVGESIPPDIK